MPHIDYTFTGGYSRFLFFAISNNTAMNCAFLLGTVGLYLRVELLSQKTWFYNFDTDKLSPKKLYLTVKYINNAFYDQDFLLVILWFQLSIFKRCEIKIRKYCHLLRATWTWEDRIRTWKTLELAIDLATEQIISLKSDCNN